MVNTFESSSDTHVDSGALDQSASNSRVPEDVLDNTRYYDMSGDKLLIILNQRQFMKTRYFNRRKPLCRKSTNQDRNRLENTFKELGFKVIVMQNYQYHDIIQKLTAIAALNHTRTSCIGVAILTHGDPGGQIFAADRRYMISEVMKIFATVASLVGKPKIYFVQACRGHSTDAGQTVRVLGRQSDGVLAITGTSHRPSSQDLLETDAELSSDRFDSQSNGDLTIPSHADSLVLYACAEDHVSYRKSSGSWMIQALCRQIQDFHKNEDILDIIIRVNAEVARKTSRSQLEEKNKKKQMPETSFTLLKKLKL